MADEAHPMVKAPQSELAERRPRVVILGGGFGGLNAAKKLAGTDVEVVIVDRENHHLFQPLLYQVATAGLSPGDIATPIRAVVSGYDNVHVRMAEAESIDRSRRVVATDIGEIPYDYLIVAVGTRTKYFGPPEWQANTTGLKSVEDALSLRRQILYAFERAEESDEAAEIAEWLTFVVVGGGPTGVEMAGAIREIAAEVMVRDFRSIEPDEARVILIDALPHILNSYPTELSEHAKEELEERDVEVLVDSPVEEIGERHVTVNEERIPTRTVVWAAGVEPVPVVGTLEAETDEQGLVKVGRDLRIPGDDRVFVIGDIAHFVEPDSEQPLPGLAPVAIQQGKSAAKNIRRLVEGREAEPFEYWDRGQMSTIGRKSAVGVVGTWKLKGFFAWLAWLFIHLMFLIGFRNKVSVLLDWAYSYIAFQRGARLIIGDGDSRRRLQDKGREEDSGADEKEGEDAA